MFLIMLVSGALSTMNVWVDKVDDMRFSVNDLYMILLMSGWMLFFMAAMHGDVGDSITGLTLAGFMIFCIRTQLFVTETHYLQGMIPHHSMAIHMSKRLKKHPNTINPFLEDLINNQEREIDFMKRTLQDPANGIDSTYTLHTNI
jgi:hypothetical protein